MPAPARRRSGFLPEVQFLRALAVALVVAFHLAPHGPLPGGFVGVDAFFVISGFLITGHLWRGAATSLRQTLPRFYARRARRLLPAALVMLAVTAVASVLLLPTARLAAVFEEVRASALYVENWVLLAHQIDYSRSTDPDSPVQHAWSLSVEEQFYLVWPLLIAAGGWLARRAHMPVRRVVVGVLAAAAVATFGYSVAISGSQPDVAYLSTLTRVWEFAAGGLLALLIDRVRLSRRVARWVRRLGVAGLLGSAVLITGEMAFPGVVALVPVLATAAVILAGDTGSQVRVGRPGRRRTLPTAEWRLLSSRPVQWLGDASYSVYLWHWPLIILAPSLRGATLSALDRVLVLAATLVLAYLSRRYVELPFLRDAPRGAGSPRRTLLAAAAAMGVAAAVTAGGSAWAQSLPERPDPLAGGTAALCQGANAALHARSCGQPFSLNPPYAMSPAEMYDILYKRECEQNDGACWPKGTPDPEHTIALIGDSHAMSLYPAVRQIAQSRGWGVTATFGLACVANTVRSPAFLGTPRDPVGCPNWTETAYEGIAFRTPDLILTTGYSAPTQFEAGKDPVAGYHEVWRRWAQIAPVVVLRDYPATGKDWSELCTQPGTTMGTACRPPRAEVVPEDAFVVAAKTVNDPRVQFLDLTSTYCDESWCYPVVGGLPVYHDNNHIAASFSATLAETLAGAIRWP